MVIDTSALASIWRNDENAERLFHALMHDGSRVISAATVVDAAMRLLAERGGAADLELDALLRELDVRVLPMTAEQSHRAREAARTYGHGRHEASLTLADCFSYAASVEMGEPLLFVSERLAATDVDAVMW